MIDSWQVYNDFLLHGQLDRFTKIFARYELYKYTINIPGHIVEGGVFKGTSVLFWAKLISIFNPLSSRKVVGFDTFGGYVEDTPATREFIEDANYEPISPESIMNIAQELGLEKRISLVKGDACETIPQYIKDNPGFRIALLNLDFDVYKPTKVAIENFCPLTVSGGIIAIDEYAGSKFEESNAVDSFIKGKRIVLQSFPWALSPTAYFQKAVG